MKTVAIIASAGSGTRMAGVCKSKTLMELNGMPVLARTMAVFEKTAIIDEIIVSAKAEDVDTVKALAEKYGISKLTAVAVGGETRQQSVANALALVQDADIIAIHDGARPMIRSEQIESVLEQTALHGAATAACPVYDTVKTADGDGYIASTLDRRVVWTVQTPQCFKLAQYREAMAKAQADGMNFTDDCQLMEYCGKKVKLVDCGDMNMKLTVPRDIEKARAFLNEEAMQMRIGHGYDVHKLGENRKLIIGGVDIPYERGLVGHSDADVLVHAVMDALLGAASLGDIGRHFPDSDEKYRGISSLELLFNVNELLKTMGFSVGNIDATLIAQKPKVAPYVLQMRENIAETLGVDVSKVNVKATTEEHLGFTGREEGMAAHAVALIY